jgi:hypothetical protein
LGEEPLTAPFQKITPASGPVTHFQTPSVSLSDPPIQPAPEACFPAKFASIWLVKVAKYPCLP